MTLIAARVTIAAAFLLGVIRWRGQRLPRDGRSWRMLFVQAVFNSIGAWTVLAWGQRHVDSGLASVLNSTSPVFVCLITALVTRHETISGTRLAGACIGVVGVTLTVGVGALEGLGIEVRGTARHSRRGTALCLRGDLRPQAITLAAGRGGRGNDGLGVGVPDSVELRRRTAVGTASL